MPYLQKTNPKLKGKQIKESLFRHASSFHETDLWTVDGSTVRKSLPSLGTQKIFRHAKLSFSEANDGAVVRTVDQSTIRQSPAVVPHLESSKIRYWNPRSIILWLNQYGPQINLRTVNVHRGSTLGQISLICPQYHAC